MKTDERLSVQMAREHVENGHGGEYAPYCYRCNYHWERQAAAQWQLQAIEKTRFWLMSGWPHWTRPVGIGSDEFYRHTVWIGPLVIALWRMRDNYTKGDLAALRWLADNDTGQLDRDGQRESA